MLKNSQKMNDLLQSLINSDTFSSVDLYTLIDLSKLVSLSDEVSRMDIPKNPIFIVEKERLLDKIYNLLV